MNIKWWWCWNLNWKSICESIKEDDKKAQGDKAWDGKVGRYRKNYMSKTHPFLSFNFSQSSL